MTERMTFDEPTVFSGAVQGKNQALQGAAAVPSAGTANVRARDRSAAQKHFCASPCLIWGRGLRFFLCLNPSGHHASLSL